MISLLAVLTPPETAKEKTKTRSGICESESIAPFFFTFGRYLQVVSNRSKQAVSSKKDIKVKCQSRLSSQREEKKRKLEEKYKE